MCSCDLRVEADEEETVPPILYSGIFRGSRAAASSGLEVAPELSADNGENILVYLIESEKELDQQSDSGLNPDPPVTSERSLLFYLNDIKSYIEDANNNVGFEEVFGRILANDRIFSSTEKNDFDYQLRALAFGLSKKYPEFSLKATNGMPVSNLNTALHQNDLTVAYSASPNTDAGR